MTTQIAQATENKRNKETEIRELEKQTTSVQPTIEGINALLSSFGFQGFKLAKASSGTSYKLVRADGSDAKATLSEGEKTFVCFLYFYHLQIPSGHRTNCCGRKFGDRIAQILRFKIRCAAFSKAISRFWAASKLINCAQCSRDERKLSASPSARGCMTVRIMRTMIFISRFKTRWWTIT